jgi:C1A family cysteine protease
MDSVYRGGGWQPDPLSKKYEQFDSSGFSLGSSFLTKNIDLRPFSVKRHDQGATSTCVANSVTKALEIKRAMKYGVEKHVDLSRLDLYYGARERMNPAQNHKDAGTYIYLACEVLRDFGVCRESMHPFSKDNIFKKPPIMASREGRLNRIKSCFKISSVGDKRLEDIVFNLKAGNPIVFGTVIGKDWFEYKGKEPLEIEKRPECCHAMCVVGYIDGNFVIENSWGNWGLNGFCFVKPEVMASDNTKDLWVIVDGSENWTEK